MTDALESLTGSCKRNPVIPVLLPQSIELYIAWLSILKAGAAVCPLNLDAPPERIKYIANDVGADIIVTTRSLASRLKHLDNHIQTIITEDVDINAKNIDRFQAPQIDADDIAYVEYTSGSTGLPKGVAVSHRAATQSLLAHDKWIPPFKRFLQFASPTFDVSIFEIIFPLFRGVTLVGCDRNLMLGDLPRIITELDVDGAELTPTVAGELLQRRSAAPCLKVLLTIGEMLTRKVVDEFGSSPNKDGILYAMYGPTEAAIHCTLAPNISAESRVGNIGVPLQTVSTFIVSPQFPDSNPSDEPEILPIGHIGELAIGGPQLAECYINREEETKKAFLVTGRKNIDRPSVPQMAAKFMIPGDVELLDNLPRLPSGKIDNAALERDYSERRNLQRTDTTGFDDQMQRKIASCVEDVLNLSVGKSTSLTQAGLDSLKAIKLASVLRNAGINIDVLGILEADSIPGIAARSHESNTDALTITGKFESDNWKCVVNATFDAPKLNGYLTDVVDVVPCSPVQMAMLSETMRDPKAYLNWIELQFHESIRINDVKHAFYEIGLKNEILRSSFIPTDYPNHSHVQVIWNKLGGDKVQEVSELKHDSSSHEYPLLNPFYVELTEIDDRIHALVHIHHAV
ncbi:predicted protein [Histoplasma mississippiense (nom. inval.)]|uniref:predicted protein n=1 Tax=Ajellomyces capsulatus (strain NAm1 / WU24) TaxID=2059318 RepID=UPI000157CF77|nr:predicted protein [Histoplasma mississippiense (nom. inval.)]EDN10968.1 predicted protein [Histoplasma mississippiense (nom. inval.)]